MSWKPTFTPDSEETKFRDEYRLLSVKRQQRQAIQLRTDQRVKFYRQKVGYYLPTDQRNGSSSDYRPPSNTNTNNQANRPGKARATTRRDPKHHELTTANEQSVATQKTSSSATDPIIQSSRKRSTTSSATQTLQGDIKPFRTFPFCQQNNLYWKIVIQDKSGITWTRFKPNGNQEWLTRSIRPGECWQFNISKEITDILPS